MRGVRRRSHALLSALLVATDLLALAAGVAVATPTDDLVTLVGVVPIWLLLSYAHGLYTADGRQMCHRTSDEFPPLLYWAVLGTASTALVAPGLRPLDAVVLAAVALTVAIVLRGCLRQVWRATRPPELGIVVGIGELADALVRKLEREPGNRLVVARQVAGPNWMLASDDERARRLSEIDATIASGSIDRVIVAQDDFREGWLEMVVSLCRRRDVKLTIAPTASRALGTAAYLTHLAELPLIEFSRWRPSRSNRATKRTLDILGAIAGLVVFCPLLLLIAMAVKLDSRGPVLYRQQRAGRGGRVFSIIKFRTMVKDAEAQLGSLVDLEQLADPMYKLRWDPRVTRTGRLLRRTSLDELPQLVNVLRGEMSLVGPRPEDVALVQRYDESARRKLDVRPGVTGPMQVYGRGDLTFHERVALEHAYVENYSLATDIKILMRTVTVVIARKGAY